MKSEPISRKEIEDMARIAGWIEFALYAALVIAGATIMTFAILLRMAIHGSIL